MKRRLLGCAIAMWAASLAASPPAAAADPDYVERVVAEARQRALDRDPVWLNLVHYRKGWFGYRSLVDDPRFFLAPDGKTNPRAEMEADLRGFFGPCGDATNHPVCRFVARFHWLKEQLQLDEAQLPCSDCPSFREVYDFLQPSSVALVFPSAYMNSPASMFGHTLLVFDSKDMNRLLARAVSYAAQTRETIGPLFAFAGIFGLYPGYYAYQPYYEKVEQYGDIGHRDVWEYDLDLTQGEIDLMLRHAWELQGIYSRYYFFSENCAYNLYYFLDVARPSLRLTEKRPWFVIPINTVQAVDGRALVRDVRYRPSTVTKIRHRVRALSAPEQAMAFEVAKGRLAPDRVLQQAPDERAQRNVLTLAAEYVQYQYTEELLPRADYSKRLMDLLKVRSALGRAEEARDDIPVPVRPDLGHRPAKVSLGSGWREREAFQSLRYRLAYHALEDNDAGFDKGAQIQFLHTEARYYDTRDELALRRLDLVDVFSLAPRDAWFRQGSWKARFGVEEAGFDPKSDDLMAQVNTGAGLAWETGPNGLLFAMVEGDAQAASHYRADYALGVGPSIGWAGLVTPDWKQVVQAKASWMGIGDDLWRTSVSWVQDVRLRPNRTLSIEAGHSVNDGASVTEVQVRANFYF